MGIEAAFFLFIAGGAAAAASSIIQARGIEETEELRQQSIKNETRQEALNAEQEEITRRRELQYANADVIVNTGNIDPFGSPSLLAIRRANLENTERDIRNIKIDLSLMRAQGSNEILASQLRSHAARTTGILDAASSILGSTAAGFKLKAGKPPGKTTKKKISGSSGITPGNA